MCVYKALGSSPGTIKQRGMGREEMEARRRPTEREMKGGGDKVREIGSRGSGGQKRPQADGDMTEKPKERSHGAGAWCAHW